MAETRAVLFDFGGTLYDYATLEAAERESLVDLTRWAGIETEVHSVEQAYRAAMRRVFRHYLPRRFYLHRDLFRDAVVEMLKDFGATADTGDLERYRSLRWQRHARDFRLREGVLETLAALRQRGLATAIVSNIDNDQLAHLLELAGLARLFDHALSSEAAQSCKPDRAIFEAALRLTGCSASKALFVGDTIAQDIVGANAVGMRSVLLWHRDDRQPPADGPRPQHVIRRIPEVLELLD